MSRIIENTFSNSSVRVNFQKKVFRRNGRYYLFRADKVEGNIKLYYRHSDSVDGLITAVDKEATSTANSGWQFGNKYDVYYDRANDRVGVAWIKRFENDGSRETYFKYGDFAADGDINWHDEHLIDDNSFDEMRYPVLGCAANGNWGVFLMRSGSSDYEACFYAAASGTPNATAQWQDNGNVPQRPVKESNRSHRICQIGTSGAGFLLVYKIDDKTIGARRWDGSSLGAEKTVAGHFQAFKSPFMSGAVADPNGNVHLVNIRDTGNDDDRSLNHAVYDAAADNWQPLTEDVNTGMAHDSHGPALQIDGQGNLHALIKEQLFDTNGKAGQKFRYFYFSNGNWQDKTADLCGDMLDTYSNFLDSPNTAHFDDQELLASWTNETPTDQNELWMAGCPIPVEVVGPTADFTAAPVQGTAPLTVTFTDQSTPGTNPITSWNWEFGDTNTGSGATTDHTYTTPGTYTVKLTVSDDTFSDSKEKNNLVTVTQDVVILPPQCDFSGTPKRGTAPLTVKFTDQSTPGTNPITTWGWKFGDGQVGSKKDPEHTFNNPGSYTVELTVSDGTLSDSKRANNYVIVEKAEDPVDECCQKKIQCMLCYLFWWLTGIFFWVVEKDNKCVRFHALQSILTFGFFTILLAIFYFTALWVAFSITLGLAIFLWLILMIAALMCIRIKLPVFGKIAHDVVYG